MLRLLHPRLQLLPHTLAQALALALASALSHRRGTTFAFSVLSSFAFFASLTLAWPWPWHSGKKAVKGRVCNGACKLSVRTERGEREGGGEGGGEGGQARQREGRER